MISLAAVLIAYEAIRTVVEGIPLKNLTLGLGINFAGRGGERRSWACSSSARANASSPAPWSPTATTCSRISTSPWAWARGCSWCKLTGITWLDPAMALGVSALLAVTGFKLVRSSSAALLDAEDPGLLRRLVEVINKVRPKDIVAIHELRTLRSGRYTHVDIHMVIPEFYGIGQGHELADGFAKAVLQEAGLEGRAAHPRGSLPEGLLRPVRGGSLPGAPEAPGAGIPDHLRGGGGGWPDLTGWTGRCFTSLTRRPAGRTLVGGIDRDSG